MIRCFTAIIWGLSAITGYAQPDDYIHRIIAYTNVEISDIPSKGAGEFPDYFEHQDKIDSIYQVYTDHRDDYKQIKAVEKFQMDQYNPDILLDSIDRIVRLQNGKEISVAPRGYEDKIHYTFTKSFKDNRFLLFHALWEESDRYVLIDTRNGYKVFPIGLPVLSPDKTLLICTNDDIEAGYGVNGLQLFDIDANQGLREVWTFSPLWAPEKVKWENNTTLIVKGYYYQMKKLIETIEVYKKITF